MDSYVFKPLLKSQTNESEKSNIDTLKNVSLNVKAYIGEAEISIDDLLNLKEGSIIELEKSVNEPIIVEANGKSIAKGEVVVINEKFAIRIKEILKKRG